jgi:hypothetical protein
MTTFAKERTMDYASMVTSFVTYGGWISVVGAAVGWYIGDGLQKQCLQACHAASSFAEIVACGHGCPTAWQVAFFGMLPGLVVVGISWGVKKWKERKH